MSRTILIILASVCVAVFLLLNLSDSIDGTVKDLLARETAHTEKELDNFFHPIIDQVNITVDRGKAGSLSQLNLEQFNGYFWPFVSRSKPVSSLMLSDSKGREKMFLELDSMVMNRESDQVIGGDATISEWRFTKGGLVLNRRFSENLGYDARVRPWFKLAMEHFDSLRWTTPYTFFTTKDPGITVSRSFRTPEGDTLILGFDVMLQDISKFTTGLDISQNGRVFIVTDDNKVLGLPHSDQFQTREQRKASVLKDASEINEPALVAALEAYSNSETGGAFLFSFDKEFWWGTVTEYSLGDIDLKIGVIAPESDFLGEIKRSRRLILSGLLAFIIFIILVNMAYSRVKMVNDQLSIQKKLVEEERDNANRQQQLVERKNAEIIDSINYAKKIQDAILPPETKLRATIPDSFVVFIPKDIVAGDFYWFDRIGDEVFFAAADCTGHGVPGAMLSLVCSNKLQRVVKELDYMEPAIILDKVRDIIVDTLGGEESVMNDGMDISFCRLNLKTKKLLFAGAHNSLFIVTSKDSEFQSSILREENETHRVFEFKGDKQPIAMFSHKKPFGQVEIQLNDGDHIYISTDGIADQFGGPDGRKMMYKGFRKALLEVCTLPVQDQSEALVKTFHDWMGDEPQVDDVCIIGLRVG